MKNNFFLVNRLSFLLIAFVILIMVIFEKESGLNTNETERVPAVSTGESNVKTPVLCSKVFSQAQNNPTFSNLVTSEIDKTESLCLNYE